MPNRHVAALVAVSILLAVPGEARPRDPFTALVVGVSKAFQSMKVGRKHVQRQHRVARKPLQREARHARKPLQRHVTPALAAVSAAKPRHPTKVAAIQFKARLDEPKPIPSITVRPLPKDPPQLANASGLKVLPDRGALRDLVVIYATRQGIEPSVALALVQTESQFDPWATGSAGEIGLMQIKCQTAIDEGYTGSCRMLYGVGVNLLYGMKYLAHAQQKSGGTLCGTLSRYNAGLYSGARRSDYCRRVQQAMN